MLVIPALGRQGQVDFWSQLAILPIYLVSCRTERDLASKIKVVDS